MSEFQEIIAGLEAKAKAEWTKVEAAGEHITQELVQVVEDGFAAAAKDFGGLAISTALKFMQEEYNQLTGAEKHGNVVTTLIQEAEAKAKVLAIADAQALAKNAFLAVVGTAPG